jgi:hypothetical protein
MKSWLPRAALVGGPQANEELLLKLHGHAATHQLAAAGLDDFDLVAADFTKIFLSNFRGHLDLHLLGFV